MRATRRVTLFHAPQSRSSGVLALLEELGADYQLQVLDLKAGQQREPAFLAINPLGKVPVIRQGEGEQAAVVTEQVAIYLHLADLYPEAGLAPQLDDPLRGPYLRWMSFYGSCLEPAIIDRSLQRDPAAYSTSPYGDFDTVLGAIRGQLASCDFAIPTPADGRKIDYNKVKVELQPSGGGAPQTIPYNPDCTGGLGWHYDNTAAPTKLELCGGTCATIQSAADGTVEVSFTCEVQQNAVPIK